MKKEGVILKMKTELKPVVDYYLPIGTEEVYMNELIGKNLNISYLGEIHCIRCDKLTKKSYFQGYCYPCFINSPETDECILRPELCRAHEGISRDMEWSKNNCLQDHYAYLAITSGLKVGVTRFSQIPIRWIDQGAWKTIRLARTPNRHLAGTIEVELKRYLADKTNWRHMLTNQLAKEINLEAEKFRVSQLLPEEMKKHITDDNQITEIKYPVKHFPEKVKSISFDNENEYQGKLSGIKGQYLIFEGGNVINIRKHNGYLISLKY